MDAVFFRTIDKGKVLKMDDCPICKAPLKWEDMDCMVVYVCDPCGYYIGDSEKDKDGNWEVISDDILAERIKRTVALREQ